MNAVRKKEQNDYFCERNYPNPENMKKWILKAIVL